MRRLTTGVIAVTIGALLVVGLLVPTSAQQQTDGDASITFEDQTTDGAWVEIQNATLPQGGFIAVYNHTDGILDIFTDDDLLGHSDYLEPGNHSSIIVWLDAHDMEGEHTLMAALYHDDGNQTFHHDTNERYQRDGEDVTATATVQFDEAVGAPPDDSPTPTPEDPEPTPAPGMIAVVAIAVLGFIAARRR
jgi:hypothetical protein